MVTVIGFIVFVVTIIFAYALGYHDGKTDVVESFECPRKSCQRDTKNIRESRLLYWGTLKELLVERNHNGRLSRRIYGQRQTIKYLKACLKEEQDTTVRLLRIEAETQPPLVFDEEKIEQARRESDAVAALFSQD